MKKQQNKEENNVFNYFKKYGYFLLREPDPKEECDLYEINNNLADIVTKLTNSNAKWCPVGGTATAIGFGYATRNHLNIDIEIEESQLPVLKEGMANQNYKLCEEMGSARIRIGSYRRKFGMYKEIDLDSPILEHKLKLIHTKLYKTPSLLRVINVNICRHTAEGTIINIDGKSETINEPYYGQIVDFKGVPVQLRSPTFSNMIRLLDTKSHRNNKDIGHYDRLISDANRIKYEKGPPDDPRAKYTYREVPRK